ncbi:hypothetical protein HNQ00_002912 [Flavobacterium sp. 14A]|nr:hypothetical protein [Flavobacterium sp. 14A]
MNLNSSLCIYTRNQKEINYLADYYFFGLKFVV